MMEDFDAILILIKLVVRHVTRQDKIFLSYFRIFKSNPDTEQIVFLEEN